MIGGNQMVSQTFQIKTIHEYLNYFIDKVNDPVFSMSLPKIKEEILQNCGELEQQISSINKDNFFQCWGNINRLEAQIWILLELSEVSAKKGRVFTEEEVVLTAQEDCQSYFKEKCGMRLLDETPHSLHFSIH
jgi:hypothetical protein